MFIYFKTSQIDRSYQDTCSWRKSDVSEVEKVLAVAKNFKKTTLRHPPTVMTS